MNIGLIGCGTMGGVYADRLAKMEGVRVSAVCHPEPSKVAALADSLQAKVYSSYADMLARPELDIVCVTTPTYLHKRHILEALNAGKHVICEKPLALNEEDCREVMKRSAEKGVRVFVAHVVRFFPEYAGICERLRSGEAGGIISAKARRVSLMPKENSWFLDRAKSGGIVFDLMIHDIDYILWLLGDSISQISANRTSHAGMEIVSASLTYANGTDVTLEACWGASAFQTELEIIGERGVIACESGKPESPGEEENGEPDASRKGVVIPESPEHYDPYYRQLAHFVQAIVTNRPALITTEEASTAVGIARRITELLEE
ncbi:MAG TPA: Gfo/Idh/MocA family oxidoreductase [Bacilli bacterium]